MFYQRKDKIWNQEVMLLNSYLKNLHLKMKARIIQLLLL